MYTIRDYGKMISDTARIEAYSEALRRAINKDAVVVDIGTGTGIFALLACRFGARKVYAIEPSTSIELAKESAIANDFAGQIEFFQAVSTSISLPERADIVVSDLRGILPIFNGNLPTIIDARTRFLKPDGILMPSADLLWVALAEAPDAFKAIEEPWLRNSLEIDIRKGARYVANEIRSHKPCRDDLLTEPACWAQLDYSTLTSANISGSIDVRPSRPGVAHGLSMWFVAEFDGGPGFSSAPWENSTVYGTAFFPLENPVKLNPDDLVTIDLNAYLTGDNYVWTWTTIVHESSQRTSKAISRQCNLYSMPLSISEIRKRASDYVPVLSHEGCIDRRALELMDGSHSLSEICAALEMEFSELTRSRYGIMERIRILSQSYSST
jgi:protein arginine N-methyltransferase 1